METFDSKGERENGSVRFQLKATESTKPLSGATEISVRLDWRDVLYWLNEREPGILIVYDASQDEAWWLLLQDAIRRQEQRAFFRGAGTLSLRIPLANRLNEAAIRHFARLRDSSSKSRKRGKR